MICLADLFSALIHAFFLKMNLNFSFNEDLIVLSSRKSKVDHLENS